MGSAVSIKPNHINEMALSQLVSDGDRMKEYFLLIANTAESGRINLTDKISKVNLLLYLKVAPDDDFVKIMSTDVQVLMEAHKVACGKKHPEQLPFSRFQIFLETLFLFSHLWTFFHTSDCIVEDKKVHKIEFVRARPMLENLDGFIVKDVPEEVWEKEFDIIDKNKNGIISFPELCAFTMKNVCTPSHFAHYHEEENNEAIKPVSASEAVLASEEALRADSSLMSNEKEETLEEMTAVLEEDTSSTKRKACIFASFLSSHSFHCFRCYCLALPYRLTCSSPGLLRLARKLSSQGAFILIASYSHSPSKRT